MSDLSAFSSSKYDWERNPRPHAPPAITIPPVDVPIQSSHFSPESLHSPTASRSSSHPPTHPPFHPRHTRSQSAWTNTATVNSVSRDPELGKTSPLHTPHLRDRFTKMFFDLRVPSQAPGPKEQWPPMRQPHLQSWPPLEIEKRRFCHHCQSHDDRRRRHRLSSRGSSIAQSTDPNALSADAQQCLSQFTLNAPTDPDSYPCSTCLSTLQTVPANFTSSNSQDGQNIMNAIQFCALRSVFDNASGDGQTGLSNGGWAKDVRFCSWSGVRCDGFGRVSSIQLSFPAVPAKIPDELSVLTGLTSLQIAGDSNIPAGDFPASFKSLSSFASLTLESTAVASIPSGSLSNLSTLTLVKNAQMVINSQQLATNPMPALLSSSAARTLQTLDLSSTGLSGALPDDLSGFSALVELHLDNNALSGAPPSKFPSTLQALTLTNNTQLSGAVATGSSFCALSGLQTCDVRSTGLSAQGACGPCTFSTATVALT
ncbi:RNI-like protein [Epithele typhae]|uniref:RNI-like protein n=1 Tax=Epithele typhae TaxID=378194 RepID=UPI00200807B1|nr:RNI-like protein [Epithele typhae]KAH9942132.1 RNI-like protein [Epithele typhae]